MTAAIELAIGAFDDPRVAAPVIQVNPADKLPFVDGLPNLPMRPDGAEPKAEAFKHRVINHQHPDHDTEAWPATGRDHERCPMTGGCQCGAVRYALHDDARAGRHLPLPHVPEGRSAAFFAPLPR